MSSRRAHPRAVTLLAFLLAPSLTARAFDLSVKLEPGLALPITPPQSRRFGAGGGAALKGGITFAGLFDLQAGALLLAIPAVTSDEKTGFAFALGAGARLKRPHRGAGQFFPWADIDVHYVRTGPLDRFGFSVGAGISFPLGLARAVWLGPFVRYFQIVQPEQPGFDNRDALIVCGGISVEVGRAHRLGRPAPVDRDRDGIPDATDRCPDAPEDRDGFQDEDGCPDPDNDGDGVLDPDDFCPTVAEDRDGFQDRDGCPDLDNDGDGLPDAADRCPDAAEDRDGFQDDDGCPDPDNDGDGVPDPADRCPLVSGSRERGGCPDPDGDGDGIPDARDPCPEVAGIGASPGAAGVAGCPTYRGLTLGGERIVLEEEIAFAAPARILAKSLPLLDELARALTHRPGLRLRIEARTDARGSAAKNLARSTARAEAVKRHLVERGVDGSRLLAQGWSDRTPTGRDANRSIEIVITNDGSAR
ncbi:MAG: OmpA family protein [Myxococcales bacterium]|nr:OmpA family protein [Myxococcales bacterium]